MRKFLAGIALICVLVASLFSATPVKAVTLTTNGFLSIDVREVGEIVETLRPNAIGDETIIATQFPDSTEHWDKVDEAGSDDDTTYVESGAGTYETDLYNLPDPSLSGTINSVTVYVNAKGTKAGIGAVTRIKTNGVAYNGSDITLTTSYAIYSTIYTTNPQTAIDWTWDEVNALQVGVGLKKPTGGAMARCTQVYVEVDYTPPTDISNIPNSKAWGTVKVNDIATTPINHFTITNNSGGSVSITIQGTDLTGGDDTWDLSDTATPGENIYGLEAGLDDDDDTFDVIVKEDSPYNTLVAGLVDSATQDWGLKLYMPTSVTDYDKQQMTTIVTLVATFD